MSDDSTVSNLTELTNVDIDNDYLFIVDVSDLSSGRPTGTSKRVTPAAILDDNLSEIKDISHTGGEILYSDAGTMRAGSPATIRTILGLTAETYIHNQLSSSSIWTINHNLGFNPSVEILSDGGMEIEGEVIHTNSNQVVINFSIPITGSARLN